MTRFRLRAIAATLFVFVVVPAGIAGAQDSAPTMHFGASAGLNIPLSDLSSEVQTGYVLNGVAAGTPRGWPVALRGEISYAGFGGKKGLVSQNITSLMMNVVLPIAGAGDTPYFIGGVGLNHISTFAGLNSENDLGFNFGGGWKWQLGDMSNFVELRYYYVSHTGVSRQMVPLTFGVMF